MDKYEQLSVVGEGSYGVVLKCRQRDTGQLVAIKKFLETEDDASVRKMALREIRMLKKLRHDHLVNLIEVFRRKRRFYLVLEYLEHTLLDALEASPGGLGERTARAYLYQLLKALAYCHQNSIIHRDVKPENVLVSRWGVVKLCDLGFARSLASPSEPFTEYVATRWYRAPELLVADHKYGAEVDIWAAGCLFAEMLTGDPLFPGDSDIDQLDLIIATVGKLAPRHQQVVSKLSRGGGGGRRGSGGALPATGSAKDLLTACLRTEPRARPTAATLLKHKFFTADGFAESFNVELKKLLEKERQASSGSTIRAPSKPRRHWTLSDATQGDSRPRTSSAAAESLIDYNYTPNAATPLQSLQDQTHLQQYTDQPYEDSNDTPEGARSTQSLLPIAAAAPALPRTLRDAAQVPPVSTNYIRNSHIKKSDKSEYASSELAPGRGRAKPHADLSLPYVPGASNTPLVEKKSVNSTKTSIFKGQYMFKKTKKPNVKNLDYWGKSNGANGFASSNRSPTNLPYM